MVNNNQKKLEVTPIEEKIIADLSNTMNMDLRNSLIIVLLKEIYYRDKKVLQGLIDQWAGNYIIMQMKAIDETYSTLPEEEKKKAIELNRYKELVGWSMNAVKLNWEQMLDLKTMIITN